MDFMAIDFETANARLDSACSIGIVGYENGKIVKEEMYLINPNQPFSAYNTMIHHLTEEDCKGAPTFLELWPHIAHYFDATLVFAHNALFDLSVLKALVLRYDLDHPTIRFGCTVQIARKLWSNSLQNCKLSTVAKHLKLNHHHHEALSDATVCGQIIVRGMKMQSVDDPYTLYDSLGLRFGKYSATKFFDSYTPYLRKYRPTLVANPKFMDVVFSVCGKPKSITRNDLTNILLSHGAYVESGLHFRTDYWVVLGNCPKNKHLQSVLLKQRGASFQSLSEEELLNLLYH